MIFGRSGGALDVKILGSEIRILFGSKLGDDYGPSLGWYGGTSDGKRPGGGFRTLIVSKIGTDDGILLGARVD